MGRIKGNIEEEGVFPVFFNKQVCLFGNTEGQVFLFIDFLTISSNGTGTFSPLPPDMAACKIVVTVIYNSRVINGCIKRKGLIKAVLFFKSPAIGQKRFLMTKVPFTHDSSSVTGTFQQVPKGYLAFRNPLAANIFGTGSSVHVIRPPVMSKNNMLCNQHFKTVSWIPAHGLPVEAVTLLISTREKRCPGGTADRSTAVGFSKGYSAKSDAVNVRCLNVTSPVKRDICFAKIIGEKDNDVWSLHPACTPLP